MRFKLASEVDGRTFVLILGLAAVTAFVQFCAIRHAGLSVRMNLP
jgi:hypothetical protein